MGSLPLVFAVENTQLEVLRFLNIDTEGMGLMGETALAIDGMQWSAVKEVKSSGQEALIPLFEREARGE